jgi:hypothetical protein
MNTNGFDVSPEAILTASTDFGGVGDTAQEIDGDLQSGLSFIDAGDDVYGAAFNQTFQPAITVTSQVLSGVRDGMHTTVTNLQNTGLLYNRSNELNTDLGSNLGRA